MYCGNGDLVTDAVIDLGTLQCEHYDAAIVYNVDLDFEQAQLYMELMNSLTLNNGRKPKVCLHTNPQFSNSCVEKPTDVVKYCTFVFCLLTKNFPHDLSSKLLKEEAIGLTRLAVNGEEGCPGLINRKYCVRPLHSQPPNQRNYKVPMGLTTIQGINMTNKQQSKTSLTELFNYFIYLRLERERNSDIVSARSKVDMLNSMIIPSIGTKDANASCCDDVHIHKLNSMIIPSIGTNAANASCCDDVHIHPNTLSPILDIKDPKPWSVGEKTENSIFSLMQDSAYGSQANNLFNLTATESSSPGTTSLTDSDKTASFNLCDNSAVSSQNADSLVPVIPNYETSEQIDNTDISIDKGTQNHLKNQKPESGGKECLITNPEEISKDKGSLPVESKDNSQTYLKDFTETVLEYTSGIDNYSRVMLKDENINIPHVATSEVPSKDICPKPLDAHSGSSIQEIRFVNCSNIQIGDAGTWTMPNAVTVYKRSGNTTEVIHEDSSDSDLSESEDQPFISNTADNFINGINEIEEITKQHNSECKNDFIDITKDTHKLSETMQKDSENLGTIQNKSNNFKATVQNRDTQILGTIQIRSNHLSENIQNGDTENLGKMQYNTNKLGELSENTTDFSRTENTSEGSGPSENIEEFTKYFDQWHGENKEEDRLSLSSLESSDDNKSVEQKEVKKGSQEPSKICPAAVDFLTMNRRPEKQPFIGTAQILGLVPNNHQSCISVAEEVD